jgi:riboflavin kinase/FMN adenylyltransferase
VKLYRDLNALPDSLRAGAVSIGNFDGVHRGHARIVERLVAQARAVGGPAVVFTFDPHPVRLLRPDRAPPPLTWTDRKAELLAELGVDGVLAFPTDLDLLSLSATTFFQRIVCEQLRAKALVEGPNFYFGQNREGNVTLLTKLCGSAHVALEIVEPLEIDGLLVSSSRVREAISAGRIDEARECLTQPYRIRGMVTHGAARGAKLGFPTANIEAIDTILPGAGVYAGRALTGGKLWPAAIHIGPIPTFGDHAPKIEVHLLDFSGSLYGQPLEVDLLTRLRHVQPFANVEALKKQLTQDVETTRRVLGAKKNE